MGRPTLQPANDALPAVDLDEIAVAKPVRNSRYRDDGRNTDFPRNDGGVGKQAAAFDDQTGHGGKQQHPSWIGTFRHQDAPGRTGCDRRILYHAYAATDPPGAGSESLTLFSVVEWFLTLRGYLELVSLVDGFVRLDTVRRRGLATHFLEFTSPKGDQFVQVGGRGSAVNERQNLFDPEVKDIARSFQHARRRQPVPDFHENSAHAAKYAGAFEAQIFARTYPQTSVSENPHEDQPSKGTAPQCFLCPTLRGTAGGGQDGGSVPRGNSLRDLSDAAQQKRGIVVQRDAFEF